MSDAVKAIMDRLPVLRQHLGLKQEDISSVLQALGALDAARLTTVWPWLEELTNNLDQLARLYGQHKPKSWQNAKLFGVKLPEMKKYETLVDRVRYVWAKERPGILPKLVKDSGPSSKET